MIGIAGMDLLPKRRLREAKPPVPRSPQLVLLVNSSWKDFGWP
jgi:hypothetical protein